MGHLVRDGDGDAFSGVDGAVLVVDEELGFAVSDGAEVLHGAGFEVGDGDEVKLGHGVLDGEVIVVVVEVMLGGFDGESGEVDLVGRAADADGDVVGFAFGAGEVADQEGYEVGRHFGRGGEGLRVFAGSGGDVADHVGVRDDGVAGVDGKRDVEGGLERGLVEAGEGAAGVGGFELGYSVVAGLGLREIEAAELVVQDAGEAVGDRDMAGGESLGEGEGGLFLFEIEGDCSGLAVGGYGWNLQLDGVEGDGL